MTTLPRRQGLFEMLANTFLSVHFYQSFTFHFDTYPEKPNLHRLILDRCYDFENIFAKKFFLFDTEQN
jgi:hypothetical protein